MNRHSSAPQKTYALTLAALLLLLGVTYWISHIDLGRWNTIVSLSIAIAKAALVALYFMHLRDSSGITRVAAGLGVFWLGILIMLSMTDYLSRGWLFLP